MPDYDFILRVYQNREYVKNSPAAVKMLFEMSKRSLKANLGVFSNALTCSGIPELIKRDEGYLKMVEEVLAEIG